MCPTLMAGPRRMPGMSSASPRRRPDLERAVRRLLDEPLGSRLFPALKLYDPGTAAHSLRTGLLAGLIGERSGLTDAELPGCTLAGLLHDVGKISAVPRSVLNQQGPLTSEQWDVVREHPRAGADLVAALNEWEVDVPGWIGAHHERVDGSGYPEGSRDQPLPVRVLAVADALDALSGPRPYRAALGFVRALDVLGGSEAERFDQGVVAAARAVVGTGLDLRAWGGSGPA